MRNPPRGSTTPWYRQKSVLIAVAVVVIVSAGVIVATSGESVAVRYLTALVALDIAVRLVDRSLTDR